MYPRQNWAEGSGMTWRRGRVAPGLRVATRRAKSKARSAVGEKSIAMIHVSEITALTGYVRGGCSPIGMKKLYPTAFDRSAADKPTILVSAGKIGWQVEAAPDDLIKLTNGCYADLITEV